MIAAVAYRFVPSGGVVGLVLVQIYVINVILALFNLIPIPPLDGSRIVGGLLPPGLTRSYLKLERFGFLIILGLLWIGALDNVLWPLADRVLGLLLSE